MNNYDPVLEKWNNYLFLGENQTDLNIDTIYFLHEKYSIDIEDLKDFTNKQISDLIETWDPNFSDNFLLSFKKLIK